MASRVLSIPGNILQIVPHWQDAFPGKPNVLIFSLGRTWETNYVIASHDESVGNGIEDLIVDRVTRPLRASFSEQRKSKARRSGGCA